MSNLGSIAAGFTQGAADAGAWLMKNRIEREEKEADDLKKVALEGTKHGYRMEEIGQQDKYAVAREVTAQEGRLKVSKVNSQNRQAETTEQNRYQEGRYKIELDDKRAAATKLATAKLKGAKLDHFNEMNDDLYELEIKRMELFKTPTKTDSEDFLPEDQVGGGLLEDPRGQNNADAIIEIDSLIAKQKLAIEKTYPELSGASRRDATNRKVEFHENINKHSPDTKVKTDAKEALKSINEITDQKTKMDTLKKLDP